MHGDNKSLKALKRRIDFHYTQEAEIMLDILESNLSENEKKELQDFMLNHPYAKITDNIYEINRPGGIV